MNENRVWFKDKDKANEYLIRNKKVLSLKDLEFLIYKDLIGINPWNRLVELAKERI